MTSHPLPTDPQTIRSLIMEDVIAKRAPFDGFKLFCEAVGDPKFDYTEYEFWYYRFYQGNSDLDYDRSLDPVQLKFDDLPNEILVQVIDQLDLKSRLLTRKVSRKLRQLSQHIRKPVRIDKIGIEEYWGCIRLKINEDISDKHRKHFMKEYDYEEKSMQTAYSDFFQILEIPKLEIRKLIIYSPTDMEQLALSEKLQKISKKSLHVAHADVDCMEPGTIIETLALLKPGILKKIELCFGLDNTLNMDDFASMEQFKKAKKIRIDLSSVLKVADLHHFYHFEKFQIQLDTIQPADIVALRDALASSAHFQKCKIRTDERLDVAHIRRWLGLGDAPNLNPYEEHVIFEILPNPREFLEIRIGEYYVEIEKRSIEHYEIDYQSDDYSDDYD